MASIDSDSNKHFCITVKGKIPSDKLLSLICVAFDKGKEFQVKFVCYACVCKTHFCFQSMTKYEDFTLVFLLTYYTILYYTILKTSFQYYSTNFITIVLKKEKERYHLG